jgi:hypothetical protein
MNEFIYKLNFLNLIKGSKFIETIRDFEPNRKISPIAIWKAYTIGKKTRANALLIFVSLIHSLKELYPYLEIIRLIKALYEQKLHEIIEPKIFKNHYNHYFKCLTVETKEDDEKLANSEEYKIYIEYFWKLFQWIIVEIVEDHAFDILGDYFYDDYEDTLVENIKIIDDEIKSMDLNLVYKENKLKNIEKKKTFKSEEFIVHASDVNELSVTKINNKSHIYDIKLISKDDSYIDDLQLNKLNLFFSNYFSLKIDELDNELYHNKFDMIFKNVFYYDTPMITIVNDSYHWDKPPPNRFHHKYNQIL